MSKGVKKIRNKLNGIVYNKQFNDFNHDPEPIRKRSRETCSYVNEVDIIGRQADLDHIVDMLLHDSHNDASFISIVGMGGLGKTALTQLVFNDHRVLSSFPLRLWTCVADQDQKQLNVKEILRMILASATRKIIDQGLTLDQIQSQLRQELARNKYLLVLDDVWTEDRHQWCDLVKYLIGSQTGSWVVVTTRSRNTANIIQGETYELSGLSNDDSWCLFEKTAFVSNQSNSPDHDELINIGREIVGKCARVPLAIKVIGSLVFGQEKSKWLWVQKTGFADIRDNTNDIMPILKLSFHHLAAPLKSCFSYCALFPKDYVIYKERLIDLWITQGYIIVLLDNRQSIRDVAEEYFSILLKRCFFQDIKKHSGEICSCKIHDLMHDIAENVSRKEVCALNRSNSANLDSSIKVRHISIAGMMEYGKYPLGNTHIRSLVFVDGSRGSNIPVEAVVAKLKCLRALYLNGLNIESLPSSIGELLHLRYLDLSWNTELGLLPKSITRLCNLQTLILSWCRKLKELPKDLNRLVKLRVLNTCGCDSLTYMPRGMGRLTSFERLEGWYILGGEENKCSNWKEWFYGLQDLKTLNNLKGKLHISIRWPEKAKNKMVRKEEDCWSWNLREESNSCLRSMKHLTHLELELRPPSDGGSGDGRIMRLLMEELHPHSHSNLKHLCVVGYKGVKMPGWFSNATSLPHLLRLDFEDFEELEYLPLLFPSLERIELGRMLKLRGVGVDESSSNNNSGLQQLQLLPCLTELSILECTELTCLRIKAPKLWKMSIHRVEMLSLMTKSFKTIQILWIEKDNEMVELPDCLQCCCSTLRKLRIYVCRNLQSIPNWMPKFTSLKTLKLEFCSKNLERRCQKDPPGEDWPYIQHIPKIRFLYSQDV